MTSEIQMDRLQYFEAVADNLIGDLSIGDYQTKLTVEKGVVYSVEYFLEYFRDILKLSEDPTCTVDSFLDSFNCLYPQLDECAAQILYEFEKYKFQKEAMDSLIDTMNEKIATGTLRESEVSSLRAKIQQITLLVRMESMDQRMSYERMFEHFVLVLKVMGQRCYDRINESDKPETWVKDVFEEFIPQFAEAAKKPKKISVE